MIEITLPGRTGKYYLDPKTGMVYKDDQRTVVIYRDGGSQAWCYILSYPIVDRAIVDLLNSKMAVK